MNTRLALEIKKLLADNGITIEGKPQYNYGGVHTYTEYYFMKGDTAVDIDQVIDPATD